MRASGLLFHSAKSVMPQQGLCNKGIRSKLNEPKRAPRVPPLQTCAVEIVESAGDLPGGQ